MKVNIAKQKRKKMQRINIVHSLLIICFVCSIQSAHRAALKEIKTFFKGFVKDPKKVGALFPCSSFVGNEIIKYLAQFIQKNPDRPIRILEVGAGTGSLTAVIAKYLRPIDHLDLVEISSEFCLILRDKFDSAPNISIHCVSITDWQPDYSYDFIISTLPFISFEQSFMQETINQLKHLIKSGGILSYVSYAGAAQLKQPFLRGTAKKDHKEKRNILKQLRKQYQIDATTILRNIPPIRVYHLRIIK